MDFPKKQAQRLMPLYLLEYNEKLFENHPDPEAPWGGGGGDYTAGYGIDITSNEISVDTDVIATKSDISSMVTTTMLDDALDDYALKTDLPENVSDLNNDAGYTTQTWVENQGYSTFSGSYNDLTNKPDFNNYYYLNNTIESGSYTTSVNEKGLEYSKEWNDNKISIVSDYSGSEQWLSGKAVIIIENTNSKTAISDSISVIDNLNIGTSLQTDKVEIIGNNNSTSLQAGKLAYTDLGTSLDFNLPTSKTTGTYTLATTDDIPSLSGYATEYWVQGYVTSQGYSTFSGNYNDLTNKPTIPTKTSDLTNDSGFITSSDIANDIEYIDLGSGSYTPVITQTIVDKIATNPKKYILLYKYTNTSDTYTYGLNFRLVNETTNHYGYECYCVKRYKNGVSSQCSEGFGLTIGKSPITSALEQWTLTAEQDFYLISITGSGTSGTITTVQANKISAAPSKCILKCWTESNSNPGYYRYYDKIGNIYSFMSDLEALSINVSGNRTLIRKTLEVDLDTREVNLRNEQSLPVSSAIVLGSGLTQTISNDIRTVSIDTSTVALKSEIPTATSDLTNDSGFITGITSSDVTTALGYTPTNPSSLATVATSGSYNDLSNKPTIPSIVANPSTTTQTLSALQIDGVGYSIAGGGASYSLSKTFETWTFTLSDNTTITKSMLMDVSLIES